jgi:hypothetical protein
MRATLTAVLGVVAGAPVLAEPPADGRLAAFDAACLAGYRDPTLRAAAIRTAGWLPVADDAAPELKALMTLSRAAMARAADEDGISGSVAAFARQQADRPLYLVTTEVNMPDDTEWKIDLLGCHLYDFAATAPIDPATISVRFAEEPAEVIDEPGTMISQAWNVETLEGVWSVQSSFIPAGSPAAALAGFSGVMLKITSTRE